MQIKIFELADVAAILGVEKSRVKNWTIGRPYSVRPSARASFGTGSRNLFNRDDLYLFALVQRFNDAGVPVEGVQAMINTVEPLRGKLDAVFRDGKDIVVIDYKTSSSSFEAHVEAESSRRQKSQVVAYQTDLKSIIDGVSAKIADYDPTMLERTRVKKRGMKRKWRGRRKRKNGRD